jgi:hypothetical protein
MHALTAALDCRMEGIAMIPLRLEAVLSQNRVRIRQQQAPMKVKSSDKSL